MAASMRRDSPWLALILLTAISTVGFVDRIVMNVLAVPIQAEFGLSYTEVGLLTGLAFSILNASLGILVARYAERGRRMSLIAIGTLAWSLATALCGVAANFVQMLLARIGVGVGEAVGLPAAQSVLSDYFPPEKRATAMSVFLLAPPVGAFIGSAGGGWVAQEWGWHSAFFIASLPGLLLAALAFWLVAEPPRGRHDSEASGDVPSIGAVFRRLLGLRSARQLLLGSTLASMVGFGLNAFLVFVFVRKFGLPLAQAALYSGLIGSLPGAIAVIGGGRVADWLGAKDPAGYVAVPGVALLIGGPIYMLAITRDDLTLLLVLLFVAAVFQYAYLGVTFGVFQNLLHSRMRATGTALLGLVYGLVGQGLGTLLVGWLSDRLTPRYGEAEGLVTALLLTSTIYLWAGVHYLLAGRHLRGDLAAVRDGAV